MNQFFFKFLLFTYSLYSLLANVSAEIVPPNYDFTLTTIEPFFPGKSVEEAKKIKAIQSDIFEDNGEQKVIRFKIKRANYSLDLYVQAKGDKIVDLFVRLPQHFLHDLFLGDLQKRFKKQDRFVRKDMSALYVWLNRDGNNLIYHGSCSITCFPMFVEMVSTDKAVIPLYQKFNEAVPKW